ncbi:sulfate transporter, partial [Trifolium medium]|nr:sulfate transporter [Trifolium medium]
MRSYWTKPDDVAWAQNGLVATIINGEAVPVVQSRIMDAGFNDVILIPMGDGKDSHAQDYRRGAWFLRVDNGSMEKERIDFARVLIATPNLEIVNTVVTVLVDGIFILRNEGNFPLHYASVTSLN